MLLLDICYERYKEQYIKQTTDSSFTVEAADWFAFHSPYCKLVQKGFARLMLNDFVTHDFLESKMPSLWNGLDAFKYVCIIIVVSYIVWLIVWLNIKAEMKLLTFILK